MKSKTISIAAGVLFVASQVFLFLGLDSERRPTTIPFCTAAVILLAASAAVWIVGLRVAAREKRQRDLSL